MAVRFVVGTGRKAARFPLAERHTPQWDRQKQGLRSFLGFAR